jgi:periplasmic protein TonB
MPESEARAAAASALQPSPGLDAEGLRAYRVALAGEARRYKRYPPRAIEAGWSGTTELRVSMAPGQAVPAVQLSQSSGYPVLDEAALDMLRRALPATPIPASLRERAFSVDLPIVFDLPQ